MKTTKPKYLLVGLYIAIAILAYALAGAFLDDIYIPGRHGRGIHLHNEAIAPALLGMFLFSFAILVDSFKTGRWTLAIRRTLFAASITSFVFSMYFIANPSGKRLATVAQCRETFARVESLAQTLSSEDAIAEWFRVRASKCPTEPILKSYHKCVMKAAAPSDINSCGAESKMLFERKNAS